MSNLAVIIVSYNTMDMTRKALNLLFSTCYDIEMEVFIVDNASKDNTVEMLRNEFPNITLIENSRNVGFGRANNQALPFIKSRYVLLLNTDAFVEPDTVAKTLKYMDAHPQCGILGVKLLGRDGALQPSCRYFPTPWNMFLNRTGLSRIFKQTKLVDDMSWDHASIRNCDWVPGCYYLVRKEVIDQVGLFDPRYFLYSEELDHCFAAKKAGWHVTYYPYTSVVHLGGESAKLDGEITSVGRQISSLQIESEMLFFRKNYGLSAVIVNVFLVTLTGCMQMLTDMLRLRLPRRIVLRASHLRIVWKCFLQTRMGMRPIH